MDPQLIRAVQSIADSMKTRYSLLSAGDIAQIALCLLTLFTLWYLRRYTNETVALRVATRGQVEVNNEVLTETIELRKATRDQADASIKLLEESQKQTETATMPVLVLTTAFSGDRYDFLIRNVGRGPAFNARTEPFGCGPKTNWELHHRSAFAADQQQFATLNTGYNTLTVFPAGLAEYLRESNNTGELPVRIEYQSATGNWYRTHHKIYLTDAKNDLIIQFERFMKMDQISST